MHVLVCMHTSELGEACGTETYACLRSGCERSHSSMIAWPEGLQS